jgi:membrane-associated protease RseP (regulator of RpoE activity)
MQQMDSSTNHHEEHDPEVIHAEIVDEIEPSAPWEWREVRPVRPRRRVRLPVLLFVATCLTTLLAGMGDEATAEMGWFEAFVYGLRYAVPVMTILLCHEMGHFLQAHRYGVHASLPYFIPMPVGPLGTLGAVIAMEPRMGHRKALFDIGISGPLAGLVPTFIFLVIGLRHSTFVTPSHVEFGLGSPLLFSLLAKWIVVGQPQANQVLLIDPMAFAGWVGLLITSLNLIPIGQLDGGHVLYAILRERANRIASLLWLFAVVMVILHFRDYGNWLPMLILIYFVLGTRHPPTADDNEPLGLGRMVLGWLTLGFIIVGFTPTPLLFR